MNTTSGLLLLVVLVIAVGSSVPYIRDILRGKTRPNLVTWTTWTLLTAIATIAQLSEGEYIGAAATAIATIETGLVVIFGFRYGHFRYTPFDVICQCIAVLGIILWQIYNTAELAVLFCIAADFVGTLPTLVHAWKKPRQETAISYGISAIGDAIAFSALRGVNVLNASYIVYNLLIDLSLTAIILVRRTKRH